MSIFQFGNCNFVCVCIIVYLSNAMYITCFHLLFLIDCCGNVPNSIVQFEFVIPFSRNLSMQKHVISNTHIFHTQFHFMSLIFVSISPTIRHRHVDSRQPKKNKTKKQNQLSAIVALEFPNECIYIAAIAVHRPNINQLT